MLKKLVRITIAMIFGSLILMNLSLAYSSGSVKADGGQVLGTLYARPGGLQWCICPGVDCLACITDY